MEPPRGLVIFDCDGVLVDSERLAHIVVVELLGQHGVSISLEEAVSRFIGTSNPEFLHRVTGLLGREPAGFIEQFRRLCQLRFREGLRAVDGVVDLIDALEIPYCVASNGDREDVIFSLRHTGLWSRFEGRVFCAEDVPKPKPAPDLFVHAAHALGVEAASCVVIEDTPTGVTAARSAGMQVLGYSAMTPAAQLVDAGAHQVFGSMAELAGALRLL